MERAEASSGLTPLRRARLYRDGLMVLLLTHCPIRLGSFARLRLCQQLRQINGAWWILLAAQETKSKRPDGRPIPDQVP